MNPSILLDHHPTADPDRHLIRALLKIEGAAPEDENRVPLNISVVLDRSGSMNGVKLQYAREATKQLMAHVYPDDTTSVVTFESEVDVVAAAAARKTQTDLSTSIGRIECGGMTNLSGGWLEGRSQVERFRAEGASNRIILMTDGHANGGITDPDALAQLFGEARLQGVTTSTIGFGSDFDERLLEMLADAGGGNAHYIEHPDQAPAVFKNELDELLMLSAQNLTVELKLEPTVELAAVHHSYPREEIDGGLRLRLGDLYASEPKQLLLELGAFAAGDGDTPLASVTIMGDVVTAEGGIEQRKISLPITFSVANGPVVNPEVRRTLVFLQAATARRDALQDERLGRADEGARKLRHAARTIREAVNDDEGREEATDLDLMAQHLETRTFRAPEAKYMASRSYAELRGKGSRKDILSRSRREERVTRPTDKES
jgi:Ca-activated chloride channel homolog